MRNFKLILLVALILSYTNFAVAGEEVKPQNVKGQKVREASAFQEVIDEYKAYVSKIEPKIRDEVIEYRKEVAKLNQQKRLLYRKLSGEAQDYLKRERDFKKRLPINKKDLLTNETANKEEE